MDYHVDFTLGGNAEKLQFLWKATQQLLDFNSVLITDTNLAIQQIKTDKPTFALDYLRKQKTELKQFRQQLNLWMQRNQKPIANYDDLYFALSLAKTGESVSEGLYLAARADAMRLFESIRDRNSACSDGEEKSTTSCLSRPSPSAPRKSDGEEDDPCIPPIYPSLAKRD